MNTKNKVMTFLTLSAGAGATTVLLNKYIKFSSTSRALMEEPRSLCFKWRLGNIHYTKCGTGKPILLIHDLTFSSSGYEWNQLVYKLKSYYTVYTIDLLGCGRSEKPNLTYTNYLYVQLLCDFIKSEIGHRTDIIATGASSALAIMACNNNAELFDRLMLINPESFSGCSQVPGKNAKLYKLILDLPIIGTLLYHIASNKTFIENRFREAYFYNPYSAKPAYIDHYFESAHLGDCPKAIFSSLECNYTKCNILNALKKIDNSIFIVGGAEETSIDSIINEYKTNNSAIESSLIPKTKHLPQLESPECVLELITMFFS
ncbi:MAG: alpha/beta hydrolase [Clostridium sp.]